MIEATEGARIFARQVGRDLASRILRGVIGTAMAVVLLAGCGSGGDKPPEIAFGRDVCAECHMIISEARFAAVYITGDGEERKFDDIGDMIAFGVRHNQLGDARVWVHDFDTEAPLDARQATFVVGGAGATDTPMGRGVFAFGDRSAAEAYASGKDAKIVSWDELVASPPPAGTSGSGTSGSGTPDAPITLPDH